MNRIKTQSDTTTAAVITHHRTCTLCEAMCGIEIKVQGEKILSIKGDEHDPFSRGHICPKATALQDLHEDPDRIRTPLERTAHGWREISWEDAYQKTVHGLRSVQRAHGNDAVGTYLGNPNAHNMGALLFGSQLFRTLRTKNKFAATSVDQLPHHIVCYQLFGHQLRIPVPDIDHTDYFMILGGNPMASNGSIMTVPDIKNRLKAIRERGGRIIVVDPRHTETAAVADEHHFIRPGTDALLLLAMLHTLYQENRIHPGRLAAITPDLDRIASLATAYPAERVAATVGMSAEAIRQLARDFASARRAVLYGRMGVSVQAFGTLCQYLIMVLNIVTGRLDHEGGLMFTAPAADIIANSPPGKMGRSKTRVRGLPGFSGELPVAALAEEILTPGKGQIKAMVLAAGNPVLSTPNGQQLDQAFATLDFMVAIDFYITESTRHAHIILPPVGPLERDHYDLVFHLFAVRNTAKYSPALFAPQGQAKQDWQIYLDLTQRLQKKPTLFNRIGIPMIKQMGPSALVDLMLRSGHYGGGLNLFKGLSIRKLKQHPHGIDLGPLKPALPSVIRHKDKKIHLCLDYFAPDLQRLELFFFGTPPITNTPSANARVAMALIGRRHVRSNNSWLHNSKRLVKGKSRCTAMLHPDDALSLGVESGQPVTVTSRTGSVTLAAEITEEIMRGVISIPHGWGHTRQDTRWKIAEQHAGVSVNDLTDELCLDALSGNAALNGVQVWVTNANTSA